MRPYGTYDETYAQDMAVCRTRLQWGILIGGLILLLSLPLFLGEWMVNFVNFIGISVIAALGLNILTGYAGQISLGQAAFIGVGAYTTGMLARYLAFPIWITLPCAALAAGLVGLIFGLPSLRIKGFYLAMATLAAQVIIPWLIVNVRPDITGGAHSFRVPAATLGIGDIALANETSLFYLIIPLAVLMTFFAKNLHRSRVGRAFIAIRDNDLAAEVMGINLFSYKSLAFFICSAFAGVAGCLWAYWMRAIAVDQFSLMESIWYVGIIIVGGLGSTSGVIMGTVFIRGLDRLVKIIGPAIEGAVPQLTGPWGATAALSPLVFGLVVLLFIILEPRGLSHRWEIFKASYRLWPFSY